MVFTSFVTTPNFTKSTHPRVEAEKISYVVMPPEVKAIIEDCDFLPLVDCCLTILESQLFAFVVELWHKETSFFHLLFGEMTIIFDDVSSLFHILVRGSFFNALIISQETALMIVVQHMGVADEQVIEEFRTMNGAHFLLSLLWERYVDLVLQGMYEGAARIYMLHLVGYIVLVYKSYVYVDAKYM